mmetsp:Transcript_5992/g.18464  ORF Transcript_5992/g.18464 Transcript_5992/m.18464 type:complete len:281 (-) Transcript_5992:172-1014(-)
MHVDLDRADAQVHLVGQRQPLVVCVEHSARAQCAQPRQVCSVDVVTVTVAVCECDGRVVCAQHLRVAQRLSAVELELVGHGPRLPLADTHRAACAYAGAQTGSSLAPRRALALHAGRDAVPLRQLVLKLSQRLRRREQPRQVAQRHRAQHGRRLIAGQPVLRQQRLQRACRRRTAAPPQFTWSLQTLSFAAAGAARACARGDGAECSDREAAHQQLRPQRQHCEQQRRCHGGGPPRRDGSPGPTRRWRRQRRTEPAAFRFKRRARLQPTLLLRCLVHHAL